MARKSSEIKMTLCKRLIARLDVKGSKLIKGVRFEGLRVIGEAIEAANRYAMEGIDEMLFIDAVASLYGRNSLTDILRHTTREIFVPITAGGGVRSIADAATLLASGADKIALNSEALKRPELITELATEFGSQCVVASIQARKVNTLEWEAMGEAGRERSGKSVLSWIREVQERGAGEILLTSINQDGTCQGPDHELINTACTNIAIPLIACGGFTTTTDVRKIFEKENISGIAIGTAFHKKMLNIEDCKNNLESQSFMLRGSKAKHPTKDKKLGDCYIGIVDYGMGNQQSLINALQRIGGNTCLSDQWDKLRTCDLIMLPGVGAFPEGMKKLRQRNLIAPIVEWAKSGKPLIGICLGMQMMFERGEEFESTHGLGLFKGTVKKLNPLDESTMDKMALPHMGWNRLINQNRPTNDQSQSEQYFVHSYSAKDVDQSMIISISRYGNEEIVASIQHNKIFGFQFHPERSGNKGLSILKDTILEILES